MSPLYTNNGILLTNEGKLTTSSNCCCCGCYKVEYIWTLLCGTGPSYVTYSGVFLFRDSNNDHDPEVVCYSDPDAVSAISNENIIIQLNYGDVCSVTPPIDVSLTFLCDGSIVMDNGFPTDTLQLPNAMCCGESIGTFYEDFPPINNISVTISLNSTGDCDCTGYTTI